MAYHGPVHRWDVFWADLEPHVGGEQAGNPRPVLVVSNDAFNARFPVVTIVPLTTHGGEGAKAYTFEVVIPAGVLSDEKPSIVMPHQIRTISKLRLLDPFASLEDPDLRYEIENRILEHLDIDYAL